MGQQLIPKLLRDLIFQLPTNNKLQEAIELPLTKENSEKIAKFSNVTDVKPDYANAGEFDPVYLSI